MQALSIPEALARRDTARTAFDLACRTRDLAAEHAEAADRRLAEVAEIEAATTGTLADRLREAAATGGKVDRDAPGAGAIARSAAVTEKRSARIALRTLTAECESASALLKDAELDLQIATNAACNEESLTILEAMEAARQTLVIGAEHLAYLGRASYTALPQQGGSPLAGQMGIQPLNLKMSIHARELVKFAGTAPPRSQKYQEDIRSAWQAWRDALVDDPSTPSPWAKRA